MKTHAIRLHPGSDLKKELKAFVGQNNIKAGVILTCVGSLTKATLRMADESITRTFDEKFEIVSMVGTLSQDGNHIHVSLSDAKGNVIGGHLKEGCVVYSTAEIVIGELSDSIFSRKLDERTGFKELDISGS